MITLPEQLSMFRPRAVWVNFILKPRRNGGMGKPPINPHTLKEGTINDPAGMSDFDKAAGNIGKVIKIYGGMYKIEGVGIVLDAAGITGIDLDHVIRISPNGRKVIAPKALEIIRLMSTYYEISPSGDGVHILAFSNHYTLPEECKHKVQTQDGSVFEIYDSKRHLTLTGEIQKGCPGIADRSDVIKHLVETVFCGPAFSSPPSPSVGSSGSSGQRRGGPDVGSAGAEDIPLEMMKEDELLWEKMKSSKKGKEITALFEGGIYPDRSSNDIAILNHLAYWTNCNEKRMIRMYRETKLDQTKWNAYESYRKNTIEAAIKGTLKIINRK